MNQTQNKEQNNNNNDDMLKHLIFRWASQLNEINDTNDKIKTTSIVNKTRKEMLKTLTNLGYFDKQ
ncbi:MAG: hypothetical protein IKT40_03205 [Bacilli bacterium]|nr:hypothetical protein [Bacilli bacterium]